MSSIWEAEVAEAAAAEASQKPSSAAQKALVRAYAVAAVLRWAACLLAHSGIRCSFLHLQHHIATVPALADHCSGSAQALQAAHAAVEMGQQEDHPKQTTLRRTLQSISTLQQVRTAACLHAHCC